MDPDPKMAAVARRHGIVVEIDSFETWSDAGRQFDLITAGHAWHWVEPGPGVERAARLLRRGGAIARFWSYHAIDPSLLAEFKTIYRELAPAAQVIGADPTGLPDARDPFADHPGFTVDEARTYRWHRSMTADEWAGLIGTFTDHARLGAERLDALENALRAAIRRSGGSVEVHGGTYLLLARRVT